MTSGTDSSANTLQPLAPGARIGAYTIVEPAGRGGMGAVFRVRHVTTGGDYALKILDAKGRGDSARLERFRREGQALARAEGHPNVIRVHATGKTKDGTPYLILEWASGGTLDTVVARAPLSPVEATEIVRQILSGLAWIHERGLIHRDLKPANVLFDEEGRARITDFGLVRDDTDDAEALTETGDVLGTPVYMAPEQIGGRRDAIGPPTDVWAAGVILHELLTGVRPFDGANLNETFAAILHRDPTPPSTLRPDVPGVLDAICRRALQRRPEDRYPTARGMLDDLAAFIRGSQVTAVGQLRRAQAKRVARFTVPTIIAVAAAGLILGRLQGPWATGERPGPTATPDAMATALPAAALEAGDHTVLTEGEDRAEHATGRLARAAAALTADPPDPHEALAALEKARGATNAIATLRAELLAAIGRVDEARDALRDADGPVALAQRARLAADAGRDEEAADLLDRARAVAARVGLVAAVDRVAVGNPRVTDWLEARAPAVAALAARTRLPRWREEADRLARAVRSRRPRSGAPGLAQAYRVRADGEHASVVALTTAATAAELSAPARREALVLRAHGHAGTGAVDLAIADARAATALGADALAMAHLEARLLLEADDPRSDAAIAALRRQIGASLPADSLGHLRWEARTMILEAHRAAATGDLAAAAETAKGALTAIRRFRRAEDDLGRCARAISAGRIDADDVFSMLLRGMSHITSEHERVRTSGARDLARALRAVPQAAVFLVAAPELAAEWSLVIGAAPVGGAAAPLDPAGEAVTRALPHLVGTPTDAAARAALAPLETALGHDPSWVAAWLLLARARAGAGELEGAREALEVARRLAPNLGDVDAIAFRIESDPGRRLEAIGRLVAYGATGDYIVRILDLDAAGLPAEAAERARGLIDRCGPLQSDAAGSGVGSRVESRLESRRKAAEADAGDDPVAWLLQSIAWRQLRRHHDQPAEATRARERDALERASELADDHRLRVALALTLLGDDAPRAEALLDEALTTLRRTTPRDFEPIGTTAMTYFYVWDLNDLNRRCWSRAGLRGMRARLNLRRGELDAARADAEAAATIDPNNADVLADVYERLARRGR